MNSRRLFFACWPDEVRRQAIVERRGLIDGLSRRRVPDHNLHLTLLFLGNQPAEQLLPIQALADKISATRFDFCLDSFGWFPGARVAWLGGDPPPEAVRLVDELSIEMIGLGLKFDRRPFHPHITLFRQVKARPDLPACPDLRWPIREFALIESIPSRPYQVLRTWSLS